MGCDRNCRVKLRVLRPLNSGGTVARGLVGRQYPAHCNEKNDRSLEFELGCSRPASSGKATPVIERRKAMQTSIEPQQRLGESARGRECNGRARDTEIEGWSRGRVLDVGWTRSSLVGCRWIPRKGGQSQCPTSSPSALQPDRGDSPATDKYARQQAICAQEQRSRLLRIPP